MTRNRSKKVVSPSTTSTKSATESPSTATTADTQPKALMNVTSPVSDSSPIRLTNEELQVIITKSVNSAIASLSQSLKAKLDAQADVIEKLSKRLDESEEQVNRLEQYTRRNNIRVVGLDVAAEESCANAVAHFLSANLRDRNGDAITVRVQDIEIAHPLPSRRPAAASAANSTSRKPTIIVRFFSRTVRDVIIRARRSLKDRGVSLWEDLTQKNVARLRELQNDDQYVAAWSWQGRLFARKSETDDPIRIH